MGLRYRSSIGQKLFRFKSAPYSSGWSVVTSSRSEFEKDINMAGWTFLFIAGKI